MTTLGVYMEDQGWLSWLPDGLTGRYIVAASVAGVGLSIFLLRQLVSGGVCRSKTRLNGKFAIVTGANSGIGKETAKDLARRGARVMLACRDPLKAVDAAHDILRETGRTVCVKTLDLSDLDSVRKFAAEINQAEPRLDILVNNAGVMGSPKRLTKQGYELHFATNHLGHFLLTFLLKDLMVRSAPARIVNVAAKAYTCGKLKFDDINSQNEYTPLGAYAQSKLANILFTRELSKKMKGTAVTVYSLHPGVVATDLGRHFEKRVPRLLQLFVLPLVYLVKLLTFKSPCEGAQTTICCAVCEDLEGQSGMYYSDCTECKLLPHATDDVAAMRLWTLSEEMTGLAQGVDNSPKPKLSKPDDVTDTAMKAAEPVILAYRPPTGMKATYQMPKILRTGQDGDIAAKNTAFVEENSNCPRSHVTEQTGLEDVSTKILGQTYGDNFTKVVPSMQENTTPRRQVAGSTRRTDNSTIYDSPKIPMAKQEEDYSTSIATRKQDNMIEQVPTRSADNSAKTCQTTPVLDYSQKETRSTQEEVGSTSMATQIQENDHVTEPELIRSADNSAKTCQTTPVLDYSLTVTRSTQEANCYTSMATRISEPELELTRSANISMKTSGKTHVQYDSPKIRRSRHKAVCSTSMTAQIPETDHVTEPELTPWADNSLKTSGKTYVLYDSPKISQHEADYSTRIATWIKETDPYSKRLLITEPVQSANDSAKTSVTTRALYDSPKTTRSLHEPDISANATTSSLENGQSQRRHAMKPTRSAYYYKSPKTWRHNVKEEKHDSRKLHKKEKDGLSGSAKSLAARETTV